MSKKPLPCLSQEDFHATVRAGQRPHAVLRLASSEALEVGSVDRTVTFVFSTGAVDRYGDTIDARGWVFDTSGAGTVALFGHDAGSVENVIGRAHNVRIEGNALLGDIVFMSAEENPKAEQVFRMVKGGYLNAVSVGFQPLEYAQTKDRSRPGGIDFKKQELLEISVVPIPANPQALVQAKAAGIDVERLGLCLHPAASKAAGDLSALYPALPAVTVNADGSLTVPPEFGPALQAFVAGAKAKSFTVSKKGLYSVSELAYLLMNLGWLQSDVAWEAEYEGDGSDVPAKLAAAIKALGQVLVDMTAEEVGELLAGMGADGTVDIATLAVTPAQKAIAALAKLATAAKPGRKELTLDLGLKLTPETRAALEVLQRAGKVLSADNEKCLREAHGLITQGCGMIMDMVEGATATADADPADNDPDNTETAAANAQAKAKAVAFALKLKHAA